MSNSWVVMREGQIFRCECGSVNFSMKDKGFECIGCKTIFDLVKNKPPKERDETDE